MLYAAHALLQRGFAYEDGQGHAWVTGHDGTVSRFVESEACKARFAHLVSGYRDDTGSRSSMLLGSTPLHYFHDQQPAWWPATNTGDAWRRYANNTSPLTQAGLGFWADVCASWCVRRFDDESEFMSVDLDLRHGVANWGDCACFAYRNVDAAASDVNVSSHAAPDDHRVRATATQQMCAL